MTRTTLPPAEPAAPGSPSAGMAARIRLGRAFSAESGSYFLLLGTTVFLVAFGLVMVLSSSSIESFVDDRNPFSAFLTQGGWAVIGLPVMLILSRAPLRFWQRITVPVLFAAVVLQLLVFTPLGYGYGGNRNWLDLGFVNIQPSELAKLALVLWLGQVVSTRHHLLDDGKRLFGLVVPVATVLIGLVLVGRDLGTVIVMASIVFGALFFAGVRLRYLALAGAVAAVAGILVSRMSASRVDRINAWLSGCETDYLDTCWQIKHGTWALAAGGVFGVGLGNSKAKWSWLPEADNDFIFAVIGEELGLLGAVVVLLLFVVLGFAFIRILNTAPDRFSRTVTSAIMVWVLVQAFVNIAVILGVLPVLGVPLPLISSGGSSLITTLVAIGVVLSVARASTSPSLDDAPPPVRPSRRPGRNVVA
ncbi:putative lipid II flippase FtsW [Naasia sp. SYSU D00948]|uniref:putative lipid II flippase FtsW n=1 Tax=Naasia sp. SYSU D00948 TaxID=2817379 RepID=UPI001B306983|nr:putative lipid II flippase FtsW [Naasia sp. SYSU D00948]